MIGDLINLGILSQLRVEQLKLPFIHSIGAVAFLMKFVVPLSDFGFALPLNLTNTWASFSVNVCADFWLPMRFAGVFLFLLCCSFLLECLCNACTQRFATRYVLLLFAFPLAAEQAHRIEGEKRVQHIWCRWLHRLVFGRTLFFRIEIYSIVQNALSTAGERHSYLFVSFRLSSSVDEEKTKAAESMVGQSFLVPEWEKRRTAQFHFSRSMLFVLLFRQASSNQSITQRRRTGFRFSFCFSGISHCFPFIRCRADRVLETRERERERGREREKGVVSFLLLLLHIFSCLARKCTERKETKTHSIFILPARILCVYVCISSVCLAKKSTGTGKERRWKKRRETRARSRTRKSHRVSMRMLDDEDDEREKRKKPNTKRLLSIEREKR